MSHKEPDLIAKANEALKALTPAVISKGLGEHLHNLRELLELLDAANHVNAAAYSLRGYRPVDGMICQLCQRVIVDEEKDTTMSLLGMVLALAGHQCAPEPSTEVARARKDLEDAYRKAVGMNVFDTQTGKVANAALAYTHAIVKAERDRVSEEYRNSGVFDTPDLDALDRVVDLTDPERTAI